jgi:hypothetical protein
MIQDTIETVIDVKPMREHKEKTSLVIRRVSWEQKSNVRRSSLGPLLGATLVKQETSQIRYTSTLNRVACRPLKFGLLQTCYQSVFSVLILRTQQRRLQQTPLCATSDQVYIITIVSASLRKNRSMQSLR